MAHQDFAEIHFAGLISRVTNVMPIADKLLEKRMLSTEKYSDIKNKNTSQDKMRELLVVVKSGGSVVQSYFYEVLKLNEPYLVQDLESPSSQASSGVLQSQEETQGTPEDVLIPWNQSSIKHRSTIEELRNDPSKKTVGNLNFSIDDKYIIGSGISGTQVYLGLKGDGTEVAIKKILKHQLEISDFKNELTLLQRFESRNIVRYVDFAQDTYSYYLALQLCECDLESHMKDLSKENEDKKDAARKKNSEGDSGNNARLADFGLSRKLEEGSAVYTARAGTRGWEAVETLGPSGYSRYSMSSDVQVAGMLMYYILSDGKHPFGVNNSEDRETNIREGNYSLDDARDIVAQDLIKKMINGDLAQRPAMDEALQHPYFWDDGRKRRVLLDLGDRDEVQKYELLEKLHNLRSQGKLTNDEAFAHLKIPVEKRNDILSLVDGDLENLYKICDKAKYYCAEKTFSNWKADLSPIWPDINQKLPEDLLGLLRVLRNKMVHAKQEFYERNMLNHFPDFFISLYGLAKDLSWDIDAETT